MRGHLTPIIALLTVGFALTTCAATVGGGPSTQNTRPRSLVILTDDTWRQVLEGEWMIQFHAPWCPACRAMVDGWNDLARLSRQLGVKVAKADVTLSPALSGRFFITALPTILHVKDGQFRQYRGPRDVDTLQTMIADRTWHHMEPISTWKHPDSVQMTVVAYFFRLSHALKEWNVYLQDTYHMPTWLTYAMFALVTITVGAVIGLLFVCIVDYIAPPRRKTFEELERDGVMHDYAAEDLLVDEPANDDSTSDEGSETDSEAEEAKRVERVAAEEREKAILERKWAIIEGRIKVPTLAEKLDKKEAKEAARLRAEEEKAVLEDIRKAEEKAKAKAAEAAKAAAASVTSSVSPQQEVGNGSLTDESTPASNSEDANGSSATDEPEATGETKAADLRKRKTVRKAD